MADFILSVPLGTASSCISTTCSTSRIHETHKKFRFYPTEGSCWRTEENVRKVIWPVFLTQCWPAEASFIHSEKQEQTQLLTNNGDAAFSSYFYHFVHQGFGSFGKLVPLKDPNWTVPHNLLGPSHNFHKLLHALRATVQALKEVREGTIHSLLTPAQITHAQPEASPSPQTWNKSFAVCRDRFASSCCGRMESGVVFIFLTPVSQFQINVRFLKP